MMISRTFNGPASERMPNHPGARGGTVAPARRCGGRDRPPLRNPHGGRGALGDRRSGAVIPLDAAAQAVATGGALRQAPRRSRGATQDVMGRGVRAAPAAPEDRDAGSLCQGQDRRAACCRRAPGGRCGGPHAHCDRRLPRLLRRADPRRSSGDRMRQPTRPVRTRPPMPASTARRPCAVSAPANRRMDATTVNPPTHER